MANGERYITHELKELENKILGAKEQAAARWNYELFCAMLQCDLRRDRLASRRTATRSWRGWMCCAAFAEVARENNYVTPEACR